MKCVLGAEFYAEDTENDLPIPYAELFEEKDGQSDRAEMFRWAHTGSLAPR